MKLSANAAAIQRRPLTPRDLFWRRFKRHRLAYWSLWVLGLLVLVVLVGPLVYKVGINDIDFRARLAPPSWKHPLGTDDLGRDLLARVLYGGRISLAVGLASMVVAIVVGVTIGAWLRALLPALVATGLMAAGMAGARVILAARTGLPDPARLAILIVVGGVCAALPLLPWMYRERRRYRAARASGDHAAVDARPAAPAARSQEERVATRREPF